MRAKITENVHGSLIVTLALVARIGEGSTVEARAERPGPAVCAGVIVAD
jgi:hypothetical protein